MNKVSCRYVYVQTYKSSSTELYKFISKFSDSLASKSAVFELLSDSCYRLLNTYILELKNPVLCKNNHLCVTYMKVHSLRGDFLEGVLRSKLHYLFLEADITCLDMFT